MKEKLIKVAAGHYRRFVAIGDVDSNTKPKSEKNELSLLNGDVTPCCIEETCCTEHRCSNNGNIFDDFSVCSTIFTVTPEKRYLINVNSDKNDYKIPESLTNIQHLTEHSTFSVRTRGKKKNKGESKQINMQREEKNNIDEKSRNAREREKKEKERQTEREIEWEKERQRQREREIEWEKERQREKEREIEREKERQREKEREIERENERQREREREIEWENERQREKERKKEIKSRMASSENLEKDEDPCDYFSVRTKNKDVTSTYCQTIQTFVNGAEQSLFLLGIEAEIIFATMETLKIYIRIDYSLKCIIINRKRRNRFILTQYLKGVVSEEKDFQRLIKMNLLPDFHMKFVNRRAVLISPAFCNLFIIQFPNEHIKNHFVTETRKLMESAYFQEEIVHALIKTEKNSCYSESNFKKILIASNFIKETESQDDKKIFVVSKSTKNNSFLREEDDSNSSDDFAKQENEKTRTKSSKSIFKKFKTVLR